jgi:hypothetical protein
LAWLHILHGAEACDYVDMPLTERKDCFSHQSKHFFPLNIKPLSPLQNWMMMAESSVDKVKLPLISTHEVV